VTRVRIGLSVALTAVAMNASAQVAQTCDATQLAINAANLQIIAQGSPAKEQFKTFHVKTKGENIDSASDTRAIFETCNVLKNATTTLSRDDGASKMKLDYRIRRDAEGWLTAEAMTITMKDKTLTDWKGETRYTPDNSGRITDSVMTFTLNNQPAQTRTHYDYDAKNRVVRMVAHSSLQFFEETTELSYDTRGFLIRTSSGKENTTLSWSDDGRWLKSETETNHPYSVLYTVNECTKWDEQGSCLVQKRTETEKYAKQTTRYTFAVTSDYQYF